MIYCILIDIKSTRDLTIYKEYIVRFTAEDREQIEKLLRRGGAHARSLF